jgi:hypothetical protein
VTADTVRKMRRRDDMKEISDTIPIVVVHWQPQIGVFLFGQGLFSPEVNADLLEVIKT